MPLLKIELHSAQPRTGGAARLVIISVNAARFAFTYSPEFRAMVTALPLRIIAELNVIPKLTSGSCYIHSVLGSSEYTVWNSDRRKIANREFRDATRDEYRICWQFLVVIPSSVQAVYSPAEVKVRVDRVLRSARFDIQMQRVKALNSKNENLYLAYT